MSEYVEFTKEMKKDYTILAPNMLPIHFKLILQVFKNRGYKMELLTTSGREIVETGLKYVHNDTCYPAILVIGQFIHALQSGKYDPHKTALLISQTGGGCRASNYISLLRKALKNAGLEFVPVISFSIGGLESHSGFKISLPVWHRMFYAVIYGDLLMTLVNQVKPYEITKGTAESLADKYAKEIANTMDSDGVSFAKVKRTCRAIVKDFESIPQIKTQKVPVGIVGEIYVKFSPLGNNNLEQFLLGEGTEPVLAGLLDFCLYCIYNGIIDFQLYGRSIKSAAVMQAVYRFLLSKQKDMIDVIKRDGHFRPMMEFERVRKLSHKIISPGVKMGEGWLLPAEMVELIEENVPNIVLTQPFGCLPNHIAGKGMIRKIREIYPEANIVSVDYDPGASRINQENRIKLMLSNAK